MKHTAKSIFEAIVAGQPEIPPGEPFFDRGLMREIRELGGAAAFAGVDPDESAEFDTITESHALVDGKPADVIDIN